MLDNLFGQFWAYNFSQYPFLLFYYSLHWTKAARITSYNVCYTKLLRVGPATLEKLLRRFGSVERIVEQEEGVLAEIVGP